MLENAALSISSSRFTSCYTSGGVSTWLGVMVHAAVRVGDYACMYTHVVVLAVIAQPTLTRCMVTIVMHSSIALYRPERSTTAHTSHHAHAMLHLLSPSRSLVHSSVALLWHAQP